MGRSCPHVSKYKLNLHTPPNYKSVFKRVFALYVDYSLSNVCTNPSTPWPIWKTTGSTQTAIERRH